MVAFLVFALNAAMGSPLWNTKYAVPKPKRCLQISEKYGFNGSEGGNTKSLIGEIESDFSKSSFLPQHTSFKSSIKNPLINTPSDSKSNKTLFNSSGLNVGPANLENCFKVMVGNCVIISVKKFFFNCHNSISFILFTVLKPSL